MQKKEPAPRPSSLLGQGAGDEVYVSIKSGGSTGDTCVQSLGVETMRLSHGKDSAPSDVLSLHVFCPVPSVTVRPFL